MRTLFVKHNPHPTSQSLINEAQGLETLRQSLPEKAFIRVVQVHKVTKAELHLERIESRPPTTNDYKKLGHGLAQLHQSTSDLFGLDYENYIGLAPQVNGPSQNWGHFFYHKRLWAQVKKLTWSREKDFYTQTLEDNKKTLIDFITDHKPRPRLIHGDLWSGNILYDHISPVLIDPAISYSDPECDLAMTKLFGRLPSSFYHEYTSRVDWPRPLDEEKLHQVYNLYHLLNHANLFGASYLPSCHEAIRLISSL